MRQFAVWGLLITALTACGGNADSGAQPAGSSGSRVNSVSGNSDTGNGTAGTHAADAATNEDDEHSIWHDSSSDLTPDWGDAAVTEGDQCERVTERLVLTIAGETYLLDIEKSNTADGSPSNLMFCAGIFVLDLRACDTTGDICFVGNCSNETSCSGTLYRPEGNQQLDLSMALSCSEFGDPTWLDAQLMGTATETTFDAGFAIELATLGRLTVDMPSIVCLR
jgi:hypothetical protein